MKMKRSVYDSGHTNSMKCNFGMTYLKDR